MSVEFATTNNSRLSQDAKSQIDLAEIDLREELTKRLAQKEFYGTISLQINFRQGKYNWHRITSEYTRGAGNKS